MVPLSTISSTDRGMGSSTKMSMPTGNDRDGATANDEIKFTMQEENTKANATDNLSYPPPAPEPTSDMIMQALGTSPRRILLSLLSGTGIALAGNLFGVTSLLLQNVDEDIVEETGLDTYFPRGNFKRARTQDYTFTIPKEWVADTAVELAKAQQMTKSLDYSMKRMSRGILPDAGEFCSIVRWGSMGLTVFHFDIVVLPG